MTELDRYALPELLAELRLLLARLEALADRLERGAGAMRAPRSRLPSVGSCAAVLATDSLRPIYRSTGILRAHSDRSDPPWEWSERDRREAGSCDSGPARDCWGAGS